MSKEKVSEKVQEAIFNQLAQKPGNSECADCGNRSPTWVSLDFGVFVCIRCSGVHRQIGPHITRVRSTRLDGWQKDNIEIMAAVGNKLANDFYEYKMPSGYRKPNANSSPEECRRFIDEKYIRKAFSPPGYKEPVKEFVAARERGEKPNFDFSSNKQTQETAQQQEESRGYLRKKSMSLDKLPSDGKGNEVKVTEAQKKIHQPHHNHHEVDLLSADNDLLGGGGSHANNDHNDFGDFKQAETHSASPVKKINFAGFKKASQEQPQPQSQTNWAWDMGTTEQSTQQSGNSNNNNAQQNQNQNQNQNQTQTQQQQQQKVDVMKLYSQPTVHQNHFMQGMQGMHGMQNQGMQGMYGMQQNQGWNQQNAGGWNNQGFGGQMGGMQQNFNQGGFQQHQQQGNFGYNQNMGQMGGFNQGQMGGFNQGQMGGFNQGQMYGNNNGFQQNNGFVQQQAGANNNRLF